MDIENLAVLCRHGYSHHSSRIILLWCLSGHGKVSGDDSPMCTGEICSSLLWVWSFENSSQPRISTLKVYWNLCRKWIWKKPNPINNPPKSLNSLSHIGETVLHYLSAMLPRLIQIQTPEQDVSTAGTSGLTSHYRQLFPLEVTWVTQDLSCHRLSLWTEQAESQQHPSLTMRRFKQMQGVQCPGLKQHLSSCEHSVVYCFIPWLISAVLW